MFSNSGSEISVSSMARADWKRWLRWIIISVIFLVFTAACIILSIDIVPTDKKLLKGLENTQGVELQSLILENKTIRSLTFINQDSAADLIVFVHGAPGGASAFKSYIKDHRLQESFNMLSYDRPGYNRDADEIGEPDISIQGHLLAELVEKSLGDARRVVFVSHSFGGPIAAIAADELEDKVLGHVMIAPVISPESEPEFWYTGIPHIFPFSLFSSKGWKVASTEKLFHKASLEETLGIWKDISYKVVHFHGTDDWLAPIENVDFASARIPERWYRPIILESKSHFILWTEQELITREIIDLVD